ncbi:general stress protein 26 [bacterium BMS3Abin07]|nr:general stress protein 26 [bacterium BMS3Abin07]GBE32687.1 general stress protein 26 [bacterium BMS3Bbin05]
MDIRTEIKEYINNHNIATLATCVNKLPHASTIEYANDGFILYFSTNPESQKAGNIRENRNVSLTIDEDYKDWTKIKGIQMDCIAEQIIDHEEIKRAMDIYVAKFPFVVNFPPSPNKMYKIVPKKVYSLDYEKGFGHRDVIEF